jgi:hypothetical protein
LGTLRTDLRLAGAGFFFDLDGGDFMGDGVSDAFLAVVALLLDERLLAVVLVAAVLLALLLDRVDAFLVVDLRVLADFCELAFVVFCPVDAPARARWAAVFVPASTVRRAGSPCLSGST